MIYPPFKCLTWSALRGNSFINSANTFAAYGWASKTESKQTAPFLSSKNHWFAIFCFLYGSRKHDTNAGDKTTDRTPPTSAGRIPNTPNSTPLRPIRPNLSSWARLWLNLICRSSTKPITRWRTRSGQHLRAGGFGLIARRVTGVGAKDVVIFRLRSRANQPLRSHGSCCLLGGIEKQALPLCVTHICTRECTIARAMKTKVRSRLWKG